MTLTNGTRCHCDVLLCHSSHGAYRTFIQSVVAQFVCAFNVFFFIFYTHFPDFFGNLYVLLFCFFFSESSAVIRLLFFVTFLCFFFFTTIYFLPLAYCKPCAFTLIFYSNIFPLWGVKCLLKCGEKQFLAKCLHGIHSERQKRVFIN